MKWIKGFLLNIQFFTTIPVHLQLPVDKQHLDKSVVTFPLLGLLQGFIYMGIALSLMHYSPFSTFAISFIVSLTMILLTGGIHLDGWMDSSDAFFSYREHEKRLEIMKDPRIGAFGVLSVIVLLSSRFLFIYEILTMASVHSYIWFALIPFMGKSIMGLLLVTVKSAKEEGLAILFKNATTIKTIRLYPVYVLVVMSLLFMFMRESFITFIVLVLITVFIYFHLKKKIVHWYGGMTGDVVGASVEGTELSLWLVVWLWHYFVTV